MPNELIAWVYALLAAEVALTNTGGINPATGATRAVSVVGQGAQSDVLPFVRITLTDSGPLEPDAEPFDYTTQPIEERVMLLINIFSDFEPEVRKIVSILTPLLRHKQITTPNYNGSTWLDSTNYYTDNLSDPDRIVRVAALRVRCTMEPN